MSAERQSTLGERLDRSLLPIFGLQPTYFTDSLDVVDFLRSIGLRCCYISAPDDPAKAPEELRANAVLVLTERHPSQFFVDGFSDSRVLMIPLGAFEHSLRSAIYAVTRVADSDFTRAAESNRRIMELLGAQQGSCRIEGGGSDLHVELADKITLMQPMEDALLQPREWAAIGQWLEAGLIPNHGDDHRPGYRVNGEYLAQGTSVAHHLSMRESKVHLFLEARGLMRALREEGQFPLRLSVESSRIREIRTQGGRDIYDEVRRLSGEHAEMAIVEVALSSNAAISSEGIDWSINSVMNEGSSGVHIAVGDGMNAAHIDFIATEAQLVL